MVGSKHKAQRDECAHDFSHRPYDEGPRSLLAQLTPVGAQAHSCKRKQKSPAGQVAHRSKLWLGEEAYRGKQGNQQKSQYKLGKLAPQKCALILHFRGLALRRPIDGISKNDEPYRGVAAVLASTATFPAASEYNAPAAVASAVLSTASPAQRP